MNFVNILGKVIEISHSNLEIASRINAILNIVSGSLRFDEVLVYTFDKDKRLSCRFTNRNSRLFDLLKGYRCHVGEGVVGTVAQKRSPQFFTFRDVPPRLGCLFYSQLDDVLPRYRALAFLPLADDSFLYGVLLAGSSSTEVITATEKVILAILSRELGGILRTADLLLSSKKRITELATLSELGRVLTSTMEPHTILENIALITAKALNAWFATIKLDLAFVRFNGQRFTSGTISSDLEEQVLDLENEALRLGQPVFKSDFRTDAGGPAPALALFAAPIRAKDRVLGTITLCLKREQREIADDQENRYLLNTIANYISGGLESALLNIKLRDALRELGDAQRRLIEHEKLRSLGEMTANIAHEIKNPLVVIGGFTKRLARTTHLDENESRYVDIITREVARLESILADILNYVKETPLLFELCDINNLLDEVLYLLTSDKSWSDIKIEKTYGKGLPLTRCDVQQIKQAFINILLNSFEAMHGKGTVTIGTERTTSEDKPFLAVSIRDTGGGIDPAFLDNIFNPFFTTKEKGIGLGLAISNKIVVHHGGVIEVKNKAGEGAQFIVYLPSQKQIN
ncbi:MAG: ATP-binding protein [Syntrophorhabdales bacterium]|jgi:signal transduction histidine kinase